MGEVVGDPEGNCETVGEAEGDSVGDFGTVGEAEGDPMGDNVGAVVDGSSGRHIK